MLYATPITIHEKLPEVDGRAQYRDTVRYAYVDPAAERVMLTATGAEPLKQLFIAIQPDGFPALWSVKVLDEITVRGKRRPVVDVTPVYTVKGSLHHVEVSVE